ncbi:hypothetical protein GUJ93_ZPchr0012g19254 [Zizania palustris]|uniref:Uncharacterized protein n=1 Tax=Zizania palustris TaxID=103762 RepID=A0A8J6BSC6_ZIZPA|nr:hypothetical protein GUJ93_ZPchr0012g19254 [Zizania palustris]
MLKIADLFFPALPFPRSSLLGSSTLLSLSLLLLLLRLLPPTLPANPHRHRRPRRRPRRSGGERAPIPRQAAGALAGCCPPPLARFHEKKELISKHGSMKPYDVSVDANNSEY